ncbi:MAG: DUF11 domain-containing protein [Clostridia bacterium]|nr:DUF11 domain-containing protein [Clostridia bacterium]
MITFTNQAALSYRNRVRYSNLTTGQIADALTMTKEALTATYGPGGDVTYVVTLTNNGTAALTELTLTDDLGGFTFGSGTVYPLSYEANSLRYYVNGNLQPAPAVTPGAPLVVSGVSVPAGGNAMLVYEAAVTEFADPAQGGTITNIITAAGAALAAPVTAAATVTAQNIPELSISKSLSPETVGADRQVTYTFTIQNEGNAATVAEDNVSVTDTFDPALTDIAVTLDGAPLIQAGNYTYDETTGAFATVPGAISVPAATYTQDPTTGVFTAEPGEAVLTVTGTIQTT